MEISKDDYLGWLNSPVTREVFQILTERQDTIAAQLGEGACLNDTAEHGVAVGRYRELSDLLNMQYEDMLRKEEL